MGNDFGSSLEKSNEKDERSHMEKAKRSNGNNEFINDAQ
jgi:hypothetical protein